MIEQSLLVQHNGIKYLNSACSRINMSLVQSHWANKHSALANLSSSLKELAKDISIVCSLHYN